MSYPVHSPVDIQYAPVLYAGTHLDNLMKHLDPRIQTMGLDANKYLWWQPEAIFQHSMMLVNSWSWIGLPGCDNLRDLLEIPKHVTVIGDSGGYQIFKNSVRDGKASGVLSPLQVLRWLEKNSDRAFIVDWPVNAETSDVAFEYGLQETLKNCQIYEDELQSTDLLIYKVMHGTSEDRFKRWFEALLPFQFRGKWGWSFGFRPSRSVMDVARLLAWLYTQGGVKDTIHLLGLGGFTTTPFLIYASRYIKGMTFDNSTYARAGYKNRTWKTPLGIDQDWVIFGDVRHSYGGLKRPPCTCPVCRRVVECDADWAAVNLERYMGKHLLALHNLCIYDDYVTKLKALVDDLDRYLVFVRKSCNEATYLAIHYFEEVLRIGYDAATKDFSKWFVCAQSNQAISSFSKLFLLGEAAPSLKEKLVSNAPLSDAPPKKYVKASLDEDAVGLMLAKQEAGLDAPPPKKRGRRKKLEQAREVVADRLKAKSDARAAMVPAEPAPRYDATFFEGLDWLNGQATAPSEETEVVRVPVLCKSVEPVSIADELEPLAKGSDLPDCYKSYEASVCSGICGHLEACKGESNEEEV